MATQISIPNTGFKVGTCGWLAKGLADGTIRIEPGTTKTGKGGLWLHAGSEQGCLAIFNEFDLDEFYTPHPNRFAVAEEGFAGDFPLTESAKDYLRAAASEWCDAANELRESDGKTEMPRLTITQ